MDNIALSTVSTVSTVIKVPWHEIFLFQNMLTINAFIKVAFLFFSSLFGKFVTNQKYWSLKLGHGFPDCSKGLQVLRNNWAKPMQKCLPIICFKKCRCSIPNSYAWWRISNNIFNFVTFNKSKWTTSVDWNEAARLTNLTKVWQG